MWIAVGPIVYYTIRRTPSLPQKQYIVPNASLTQAPTNGIATRPNWTRVYACYAHASLKSTGTKGGGGSTLWLWAGRNWLVFIVVTDWLGFYVGGRNWRVFLVRAANRLVLAWASKLTSFCVVVRNYIDFSVGGRSFINEEKRSGVQIPPRSYFRFFWDASPHNSHSLSKTHQRIGRIPSYITSKWLSRANTQLHSHRIRVINYLTVAIGAIVNHTNAPYTIVDCNKVSYSIVRYIRFRTASLPIKKSFLLRRWIRVHADVHGKDKYTSNWHLAHR